MASNELAALRQDLLSRLTSEQMGDREREDSLYMPASAPMLKVGRMVNEQFGSGGMTSGGIQAQTNYADALGGANSYMEMLARKRDSQAVSRMPRSTGSWEAEQQRPGSWQGGVGALRPVGQGSMITIGRGRPLFQQRGA